MVKHQLKLYCRTIISLFIVYSTYEDNFRSNKEAFRLPSTIPPRAIDCIVESAFKALPNHRSLLFWVKEKTRRQGVDRLEIQSQANTINSWSVTSSRRQSTVAGPKINVKKQLWKGMQMLKEQRHSLATGWSERVNDFRPKDNSRLTPSLALEAMPTGRASRGWGNDNWKQLAGRVLHPEHSTWHKCFFDTFTQSHCIRVPIHHHQHY